MNPWHFMRWFDVCVMLFVLHHHVDTTNTCTQLDNLPFLQIDVRLPGFEIVTMAAEGIMVCARNCLKSRWCKSFNFNTISGQCELNYARLNPGGLNDTHLVTASGYVFSDVTDWPQTLAGACANHNCSINTYCHPLTENQYTCIANVKPTSCAEVKECDSTSQDGEYWIRLVNFDLYRTRIYCYNMSTDNPLEYLTLPNPNYGIYPAVANVNCNGETPLKFGCVGRGGETWYHKIRVELKDMKVLRRDKTFANFTNYELNYAHAEDCYTTHNDGILASCGTKGRFTVDLTGTGWAVPPETTWKIDGYKGIIESVTRNAEGTIIEIKCGGFDGYCDPQGPFMLVRSPVDIPDGLATEMNCNF